MRLEVSTIIDADPESVWRYVADFSNDPEWRDAVSEMTPSPAGSAHPGQSVHEVLTFQGTTYTTDTCVREAAPMRLSFDGTGEGTRVWGSRTVSAKGDGSSRFSQELTVRFRGPKRLIEPMMGILYRKLMRADLAQLREILERSAVDVTR